MNNRIIKLTLDISTSTAKKMLLIESDKESKMITHIGSKLIDSSRTDAFLDRLCKIGLCEMLVTSWGMQEIGYKLTTLGNRAISVIKKEMGWLVNEIRIEADEARFYSIKSHN